MDTSDAKFLDLVVNKDIMQNCLGDGIDNIVEQDVAFNFTVRSNTIMNLAKQNNEAFDAL